MRDYLLEEWREKHKAKKSKKSKAKSRHKDETPEERRARKERKKEKKARHHAGKSEGLKGVEALLKSLDRLETEGERRESRSRSPRREAWKSRSPIHAASGSRWDQSHSRSRSPRRGHRSRGSYPRSGYMDEMPYERDERDPRSRR